jgi:nucleoside-diphosphate-sugar epimerase
VERSETPTRILVAGATGAIGRQLREVGTRNLVEAATAGGAHRLIVQSIAWLYALGPEPHVETDPLREPADASEDVTLLGVLELERLVTTVAGIDGIVLRYGRLYGPGTGADSPPSSTSVEVGAAARAAFLAVGRGAAGIYNVVDDGSPVSNVRARAELGWSP